tara:strand:- start:698 stop:1339 length:642 start_codon:yes stop_codon:yes gene_type:complete
MKTFLFTLIIAFISIPCNSQDIIIKKDGTSIIAKVKKIGTDEIEYLKHEKLNGPIYIIIKNDVLVIYFEDGSTEIINTNSNSEKPISLDETKNLLIEYFSKYAYVYGSEKGFNGFKPAFEGDFIRLSFYEISNSGVRGLNSNLFDLSKIYEIRIDKRAEDIAYLNIWVDIKNEKKGTWGKDKVIIKVDSWKNAELINNVLKHYNQLLLEKKSN